MKPLYVEDISITNFKNYSSANFSLGSRFNLAYGLNGSGKTNLLDSLYYLCVGRSYFTPFDQKVVTTGEPFFRLDGKVRKDGGNHQIQVKVKPGITKDLILDGVCRDRISDHLGFLPVVISAPRDIDIIIGPGASRRKYVDHLLCQLDPEYLRSLVTYNHLLHLRTSALKQDFNDLRRMVQTYDEQMSPHAAIIFAKREWLRNEILPLLQSNYGVLADNRENVNVEYESRLREYSYEKLADMSWIADKKTQRSNAGIHKVVIGLRLKDNFFKNIA
jgi:DNA replication and repair protein RecF